MGTGEDIDALAGVFKAFSDPTRLKVIKMLADSKGPLCVNALACRLDVSQSAVSQHLRVLRQAGLATAHRHGCHVHYSLDEDRLKKHQALIRKTLGDAFVVTG
jgi:DNA-binding transcriptional ArsR family regulator